MRTSVKIRTQAYFSPSSQKILFLLLFLMILSKKSFFTVFEKFQCYYLKSNCSTESKVCFVHTQNILSYPCLIIFPLLFLKVTKTRAQKIPTLSFICTPLWGREVEKMIRWQLTLPALPTIFLISFGSLDITEWWTPETTSRHLN